MIHTGPVKFRICLAWLLAELHLVLMECSVSFHIFCVQFTAFESNANLRVANNHHFVFKMLNKCEMVKKKENVSKTFSHLPKGTEKILNLFICQKKKKKSYSKKLITACTII